MEVQGKVWGETRCIFNNDSTEVHRIVGKLGGYCSKHKHQHKYNKFFVERGRLKIKVWKNDYDLVDETILGPGQATTVKPGEYHMFEVLEDDTIAYEIYWTVLDTSDIVRDNHGGVAQ